MKYSLHWSTKADKGIRKLHPLTTQRIFDKVNSILDDPYRNAERCEGYPFYPQRIRAYRAILEIDDSTLLVTVHKVGIRKKVYDR